jgi:hypothetical protein
MSFELNKVHARTHKYRHVIMLGGDCLQTVPRLTASNTHSKVCSVHGNTDASHLPQGLSASLHCGSEQDTFKEICVFGNMKHVRGRNWRNAECSNSDVLSGPHFTEGYVVRWIAIKNTFSATHLFFIDEFSVIKYSYSKLHRRQNRAEP